MSRPPPDFQGCNIVMTQWAADSAWPGEWDIEAIFTSANRYGAGKFADMLRALYPARSVLTLRSGDRGVLTIVDYECAPQTSEAA